MIIVSGVGGGGVGELPRFSWEGLVEELDTSPPWVITEPGSFTEIVVGFGTVAAIEFEILKNGGTVGVISTASSGSPQFFTSTITVVRDDQIRLDLTDFGTGLAEDITVTLRNPV